MDFFDACRVLIRRWNIVLPLLILTGFGTVVAYNTAASEYTAKGQVVLLAPLGNSDLTGADGEPISNCARNSWCNAGGIASLGSITAKAMLGQAIYDPILARYSGAEYDVALDADDRSPIIAMEVTATSAPGALALLSDVRAGVTSELNERQLATNVPEAALITSSDVTMSTKAEVQAGGKLRAGAAALGLGLAVTLGAAFLAESVGRSRAARAEKVLDRVALAEGSTPPAPLAAHAPAEASGPTPEPDDPETDKTETAQPKSAGADSDDPETDKTETAQPKSAGADSDDPTVSAQARQSPPSDDDARTSVVRRSGRVSP